MTHQKEVLLQELVELVQQLGKDGGLATPSVYDTAQVLRFAPPPQGVEAALEWLLAQQHADGGWGSPQVAIARDIPTLAALLAIHQYREDELARTAVAAGLDFLTRQAFQWQATHIDQVPIAGEMILPALLNDARQAGFILPQEPYSWLFAMHEKKLQRLAMVELDYHSPAMYSWEALALQPSANDLDASGGIAHSPAATAAWLSRGRGRPELQQAVESAERYLARSANATQTGIPGVVPTVWPVTGFELGYGLYTIALLGLCEEAQLASAARERSRELEIIYRTGKGVSAGEYFTVEVDSTAVSAFVLDKVGLPYEPDYFMRFHNGEHFTTFDHELNPSTLSNIHGLAALAAGKMTSPEIEAFVLRHQAADGLWAVDKWHASRLYVTMEAVVSLSLHGRTDHLAAVERGLLATQSSTGGWGTNGADTVLETAFAYITLTIIHQTTGVSASGRRAMANAGRFLDLHADATFSPARFWLSKELYSPVRVDALYIAAARFLHMSEQRMVTYEQFPTVN